MSPLKKLPIGVQTFDKLIEDNQIYVDKTKQIHNLIKQNGIYFFARPRRFGKSLLLSTMKAIFEGRRELFKGLAIDQLDYDWKIYPVITLDMSAADTPDVTQVPTLIKNMLLRLARAHDVEIIDSSLGQMLFDLIEKIHEKKGRVVVLIDEYDKPLLNVLGNRSALEEVKKEISYFYGAFKRADPYLRFLFLTGVSRFSRTSIFSGLNQLEDISSEKENSSLCGYTDAEVDHYFPNHIQVMQQKCGAATNVRDMLRTWYDGYLFHQEGPHVYNPFSILNVLKQREFKNYWFATGTPTFLISLLREQQFDLLSRSALSLSSQQMSNLTIETLDCVSVLYQTGYLTIEHYDEDGSNYNLKIPNQEVRQSLFSSLLEDYVKGSAYSAIYALLGDFKRAVLNNQLDQMITHLKTVYAKIPYTITIPLERYYQTIFYTIFLLAGFDVIVEEATSDGRIDVVVTTQTHRYIIELKLDKPVTEALNQIKEKEYAARYADDKRTITLIGISFDSQKRTIVDWLSE